jgi:hypothetical protein
MDVEAAAMDSAIASAAANPNVDVDKFERLMALKERTDQRNAMRAFNAAIAAARGEIPTIFKNRQVDFTSTKGRTNYRHEDLAEIAKVIDPVFAKHGLSYRFRTKQDAGRLSVTCIISHVDGHSEENTLHAPIDDSGNKNAIQGIGSTATYLQRYTLKLGAGLAASTDDDGRRAGEQPSPTHTLEALNALIAETKADVSWICNHYSVGELDDLSPKQIAQAIAGLSARKRKAGSNG